MIDLHNYQLELKYPCRWSYTLIGADEFTMRTVVADLLGETPYTLTYGKSSRTGKYCSLGLELVVHSDQQRKGIFTALGAHPSINAVL